LLDQAEKTLPNLRAAIKEDAELLATKTGQIQDWLKSPQAEESVRRSPKLKVVFSDAASAAKTVAKEQPAALNTQLQRLDGIKSQLSKFRDASAPRGRSDL
jgi:hypothetical protein